jgi:hypothetical protein
MPAESSQHMDCVHYLSGSLQGMCFILEKKKLEINLMKMTSDSGLYYMIKYGDKMRAWIDIGFSTVENDS